ETVTVQECGRRALARSAAIRAAGFEAAAAAARVRAARAAYAPRLEVHSEYGRAEGFDEAVTNGGSTAGIVRLEAILLDAGVMRAELAIHAERTALRAAERDLVEARAALASLAGVDSAAALIEPVSKAMKDASDGLDASPLLGEARAQLVVAEREAEALRGER